GTRFHAWVETRFDQQNLFEPEELPGQADAGIDDDADLRTVIEAFESGPFADRLPTAIEQPFTVALGGHVVRGRIDAVYAEGDGFLVVDWKTGRASDGDPRQLALYRLAWSELTGCPLSSVRAAFYYVRRGELAEPPGLPDRAGLERWVDAIGGRASTGASIS
ncbi:MAG: PD-(D/E)XK nuclease family protein, partial [Nocardioides sp.]